MAGVGHPRQFDHDEARRLVAAGASVAELAARYGVTYAAVYRVVNHERAAESRRRDNAKRRAAKRESERQHRRKPCLGGCGALTWHKTGQSGYCLDCTPARAPARERAATVERLWNEGLTLREIAARLGSSAKSISVDVTRLRQAGHDLPYRRARTDAS